MDKVPRANFGEEKKKKKKKKKKKIRLSPDRKKKGANERKGGSRPIPRSGSAKRRKAVFLTDGEKGASSFRNLISVLSPRTREKTPVVERTSTTGEPEERFDADERFIDRAFSQPPSSLSKRVASCWPTERGEGTSSSRDHRTSSLPTPLSSYNLLSEGEREKEIEWFLQGSSSLPGDRDTQEEVVLNSAQWVKSRDAKLKERKASIFLSDVRGETFNEDYLTVHRASSCTFNGSWCLFNGVENSTINGGNHYIVDCRHNTINAEGVWREKRRLI